MICIITLFLFYSVTAQSGSTKLTDSTPKNQSITCSPQTVSCMPAPWCKRTVDDKGCPKCSCSIGGFANGLPGGSGVQGMTRSQNVPGNMNPAMSSMFGSGMGGFPGFPSFSGQSSMMNPMAGMFKQLGMGMFSGRPGFNVLTGPSGIGTGPLPNSNQPLPTAKQLSCDPAPYTCSLPPPWCQRVVKTDGCVNCFCGKALQAYLKGLQSGSVNKTTIRPTTQTSSQTQKQTVITTTHATKQTTTSCLQSFFCTKSCPHGYMTDGSGCPLCQCIVPGSSGIVTTSASVTQLTTLLLPVPTMASGGTILCPGIFDCTLMCMNGYLNDDQGCPICQCIDGS